MTKEEMIHEYQQAVMTARLCAEMLSAVDLPKLLEAIEKADAFGPLLDPTLYRQKQQAMNEDRKLLEAALPLRRFGTGARL